MKLEISASQLSLGAQGDDVARVHRALQDLGRSIPVSETKAHELGGGTVAVLKGLQQELNLPVTGLVDAATVRGINALIDRLATDTRIVRGSVRDASGNPFTGGFVQVFGQGPDREQVLGKSPLREADGSYQVSYQVPQGHGERVDLRVALMNDSGLVDTAPDGSSILTDAGPLEVVNFMLSGDKHAPDAEYDFLMKDLKPLVGSRDIAELTEERSRRDVSLLAGQSGYSSGQVAALVLAHKLAKGTGTPAPVFYGLLRQGLPAESAALHAVHPDEKTNALKAAVEGGLVPKEIGGMKIEDFLPGLAPAPDGRLQALLGGILNADELKTFVGQYLRNSQAPEEFWQQVEADPAWAGRAKDLRFTVQLAGLFDNNVELVNKVRGMPDIGQPSDLARLTEDQWKALIQMPGVGVPADTPGATSGEKTANYARQILAQVEAAFPTRFFAERLGTSRVATFLKAQPDYDLRTTYPEQFFKKNAAASRPLRAKERQELRTFQRLYRLTENTEETLALAAKGVQSAQQILKSDPASFAEQHKEIFSPGRAGEVYRKARQTHAGALALFAENAAALNRTAMHALPKLDSEKQSELAAGSIPDWGTLFGTFDLCECRECSSVHGPAAYFVDILHFLEERSARTPMFARRPDLGDIELSCENTNTPLPLIDLVNEVLENAVSPPPPFTPFTLDPSLEDGLAQTVATPELSAAFTPAIQNGARVETLESGSRWRIWDEPYAYSVSKDGSSLKVETRSRQTTGSAAERRATPQYRNGAAYEELARAVTPWNLPFDLAHEEAAVFLTHLGVTRHGLIEALRPSPEPFDPNAPVPVRLASEELGLTDTERRILVGEPLTPPRQPEDFWDGAPVSELAIIQNLLDRSGLSYAELEALTATWFVNPSGSMTISAKPGAPVDTCDTTKLQINGLTADALTRLHRFVRLWRKLGWTIAEVDRVIHALAADPSTPVLTNEMLVRLEHLRSLSSLLRLPVMQTLALWKTIDTAEPDSHYRQLFYNPAVFKPLDEVFRLRPDGQELVHADALLSDHSGTLQAIFRLNVEGLTVLLAKTDSTMSLANLSLIYRHACLARQLGLTVRDLLVAIELIGLDPFRADRSQDGPRFVETVQTIRSSGFDFRQLDYLLRHRFNSAASFVPEDSMLAQTLTEVRSGLLKVEAPSAAERRKLQRSVVIDRVSAALGLSADVTGVLLARVTHGSGTAEELFVKLSETDPDTPLSRDPGVAGPQFETLEKLTKIADIVLTSGLPGSRINWLFFENPWLAVAPDPPASQVPFASWYSMIRLGQLRRAASLEDAALEAILSAIIAVALATDDPSRLSAKKAFIDELSKWLEWPAADLETLIGKADDLADAGLLNARMPDDYRIELVDRLGRAMKLLRRLGTAAAQANEWCEDVITPDNARAIRESAKAKHDNEAWYELAGPLQDSLRDKQREALVSYLVSRPHIWNAPPGQTDAHSLFSRFLIDVGMSPCQLTSRIKQAIASVQLFTQRCLMGLEVGVETNDPKWEQWAWMKNFRVWEANRKVWLYPENWIEPQLRDDKTPFFKDLEDELLQSDLTDASAEQALRGYLRKLDEVARLEIVGAYDDDDTKDVHVFGRTFHDPRVYYYRRRDGDTKEWMPWEKMELDIEGDHLIPVVWNRKLMLIWPVFTEKSFPKDVEMPGQGQKLNSADRYWEIQLAWSEYENGQWAGKNLSEGVSFIAYQGENNVLFGRRVAAPQKTAVFMRPANDVGTGPDPLDGGDGPGDDSGDPLPPPANPSPPQRRLAAKELFSFKGLVFGDTLIVRGFLRRDYRQRPDSGDKQIACCFGEFRFLGCRKIVTTAHRGKMTGLNFPLAPAGTKFDHMWFTGTGGLSLFDGTFPFARPRPDVTAMSEVNETESIAGDPSSTVVNKLDIPVLKRTFGTFRLLAPHQDLQFVCDRPFFFMDTARAFMVTSTGTSGKRTHPDLGGWVRGNLAVAWRSDYFPGQAPAPEEPSAPSHPVGEALQPFTVLARGPQGRRVAARLTPVNLKPAYGPRTLIATFWTTREYTFTNFHHPYLCEFVKTLNRGGIPELLSLATQSAGDPQSFDAGYLPKTRVRVPRPIDEVEFQSGRSYGQYNWELFFHIPLLIADQLSKNQRFEEAQRWFHFIFDPAGASGGGVPQSYWRTKPFYDRLASDYEAESVKTIEEIIAEGLSSEWNAAVATWRANPFSPHAVARLRTTAYQKTVVMKYIDNLIAWGDQLFRRETLESISEATHLYVLAAEILGRRPDTIRRGVRPKVQTFNGLSQLGLLGNTLEQIELLVSGVEDSGSAGGSSETPDLPSPRVLYFCVPENDKLLGYWSTVEDRLFKIRHCMNIEGQIRQLPLFEPPIDPALLVRARAAGLSIGEVLSDISVSLPNYRFSVMLQIARELAAEVRSLGAVLLSVLEKRDNEALSALRSGQELRLLQAVRDIRKKNIDEAETSIASLEASRELEQARKDYYESREFMNGGEQTSITLLKSSVVLLGGSAALRALTVILQKFGVFKLGSPTTAGTEQGPAYIGRGMLTAASALDILANISSVSSQLAGSMAEFDRRQDEWEHQANLATIELKQIDQQLIAARIRLSVAEQELRNHDRQIDDARETDQFLRGKFTNQDLYQWMIGQVSGLYFQSYQLAYDLAKRAELCMQHELGLNYGGTSIIRFGYWDSLKKGLMAGDHLGYDLKRLEVAYLDGNVREYELSKHISLVSLAPEQLITLKETGICEFDVPEWLFDLDTPGHYKRRLKMVSVTIPCVIGPYASIHCKLQLLKSSYRNNTDLAPGYNRLPDDDPAGLDSRFVDDRKILESIVTSTGQNDAGLFEPAMKDERFLPFEGAGAVSRWRLELPGQFKIIDFSTISDVILHFQYTARDGGEGLKSGAMASLSGLLGDAAVRPLLRLFSLRHEFPMEWHRFVNAPSGQAAAMTVNLDAIRFPYFAQSRVISIREAKTVVPSASGSPSVVGIAPGQAPPDPDQAAWTGQAAPGPWTIATSSDPKSIEDIFIILAYTV